MVISFNIVKYLLIYSIIVSLIIAAEPNQNQNKIRVLLIGIDGLLQTCMNEANISAFKKLEKEGSYTYKGRTTIQTISGPGWSNILCGLETEDTGIVTNDWKAPWVYGHEEAIEPILGNSKPFPCVFSELKKNNKSLNIKVSWAWSWLLNLGNISNPGTIDTEDFCDPADTLSDSIRCDNEVLRNGLKYVNDDFDFSFLYFGSLDECGHKTGFCSPEYIQRLSELNEGLEILFSQLQSKGIYESTYIILTTDHGATYGKPWHGEQRNDNMLIPFYIRGPGIRKGYELKDFIKNADVTPSILHIFGFSGNELWRSRPIAEAFESFNEVQPAPILNKFREKNYQKKVETMEDLKFLIENS
jgi:hypothetical protein